MIIRDNIEVTYQWNRQTQRHEPNTHDKLDSPGQLGHRVGQERVADSNVPLYGESGDCENGGI